MGCKACPEVKLGRYEVDHVDEVGVVAVAARATFGGLENAVEAFHDGRGDVALEPARDTVPMRPDRLGRTHHRWQL